MVLTEEQVEFFIGNNWLKLDGAVPVALCAEWVAAACELNGIDLSDPATWPKRNNFVSAGLSGEMAQLAPRLYAAITQLVGGAERMRDPALSIDSGLVANWDRGADSPWVEPGFGSEYEQKSGGECGGWHVDGDFNHFVDSPETGLQVFILWGDVEYQAGPTYIAPDSPKHITRVLLENPQGLSACALGGGGGDGSLDGKTGSHNVQTQCKISMPLIGKAGSAFLVHPQMLHTSSQNMKRRPRFMRNWQIPLLRPRAFAEGRLSPVERCIVRNHGGSLTEFHTVFTPPPDSLRMACDHNDGTLLGWKYGEAPSYKGEAPPDPGHVLRSAGEVVSLNPKL